MQMTAPALSADFSTGDLTCISLKQLLWKCLLIGNVYHLNIIPKGQDIEAKMFSHINRLLYWKKEEKTI